MNYIFNIKQHINYSCSHDYLNRTLKYLCTNCNILIIFCSYKAKQFNITKSKYYERKKYIEKNKNKIS